jgi:hypothetical protein
VSKSTHIANDSKYKSFVKHFVKKFYLLAHLEFRERILAEMKEDSQAATFSMPRHGPTTRMEKLATPQKSTKKYAPVSRSASFLFFIS